MSKLLLAVAFAAMLASAGEAKAQSYPSRSISIIVPYAAGGPTDVFGRILAEGMKTTLAQPIIVENVGGAAGNLGMQATYSRPASSSSRSCGTSQSCALPGPPTIWKR